MRFAHAVPQVVHRVLDRLLLAQAGLKANDAKSSAVTLIQRLIGRRSHVDEDRLAFGAAPVVAVQHRAVLGDVQVGSRPKGLGQRDRAFAGPVERKLRRQRALTPASHPRCTRPRAPIPASVVFCS